MADVFLFRFAVDGEGSFDDVTLREQRLDHLKSINIYRVKLTNIVFIFLSKLHPVLIVCVTIISVKTSLMRKTSKNLSKLKKKPR